MIQYALKLSKAVSTASRAVHHQLIRPISSRPSFLYTPQSPPSRFFHAKIDGPNVNPVALQMIDYALSLANSERSDESYAQGMLVLEQCLASQSSEGQDIVNDNTKGVVLLAMSNLSYKRGKYNDAMDKLRAVEDLVHPSFGVKVAATEALVGLNLELGLDDGSSSVADKCLGGIGEDEVKSSRADFETDARAKAIKGLVELVRGNLKSAEALFQGFQDHEDCGGPAALSYGEFLHATQNFSSAKDLYQKVIQGTVDTKDFSDIHSLVACNMAPQEVLLGATCALGQLESHMGSINPCLQMIMPCGIAFESTGISLLPGLYRRAIELLKAPPLELEGGEKMGIWTDVIAIARGGYAEALCVQQNRKGEGEKMKKWAEAAWRNRRMSLAEALKFSGSSDKVPVIDARIGRMV
ncbi:hypothetical protein Tsubulata_028902 [Turnera subulata]|uniref:MalT-like TPR region domain-containing protein n=1 Tax=Turnera subulata TaxID=218843 RepID=A0A9Q0GFX5_9ROSI|nr:hypothetical protein Tsubulata_028902 [Turnera subulata]